MIYVALLRGINVGGKNKVDMKLLKKTFEQAGMNSVITYINSGNIIFSDNDHAKTEISAILEQAILKDFGLRIKVLVRNFDDFKALIKALPETWKNDQDMKGDVMFLWDEIDNASIVDKLVINPGIDMVIYVPGAILWLTDRKDVIKSGKMKLAGTKLYQQMTVRNVNTTRKIYELMQSVGE